MSDFNDILTVADSLRDTTMEARLIRPIVPIREWVVSEYYAGPDIKNLYPYWREHLINIFDESRTPENKINEIIITGSIGTGKTTFANFVMLRFLYEISCYDNPQALFNLMMTSKIAFFYFNITKEQANLTGYGQLREMIDASPYFREYFKRNERKSNDIEWLQQKMYISYGSSTGHIIGTNLLGSILDEANFYQGDGGSATISSNKDVQSKAAKIYTNIINRRKISLLKKWCFANIINYCFIFNV